MRRVQQAALDSAPEMLARHGAQEYMKGLAAVSIAMSKVSTVADKKDKKGEAKGELVELRRLLEPEAANG